jgi:hypothetical protein
MEEVSFYVPRVMGAPAHILRIRVQNFEKRVTTRLLKKVSLANSKPR